MPLIPKLGTDPYFDKNRKMILTKAIDQMKVMYKEAGEPYGDLFSGFDRWATENQAEGRYDEIKAACKEAGVVI